MSTPTATLPIKTDNNMIDQSDINDPIVQDVLNEFRDELTSSKKKEEYKHMNMANSQLSPQQQQNQPSYAQQPMPSQQHYQQPSHTQQYSQGPQGPQGSQGQGPSQYQNSPYQYPRQTQTYSDSFPYFNIDFDIIKKNLIVVIIALLIYNTGLINIIYEKAPDYLQDNILPFDIYIRSVTFFITLYILSLFEYL
jgi:hypothetical protein